jgi:transposase-like protein
VPAPKKYPDELRGHAIRLVVKTRTQHGHWGAIPRVAEELSINRKTLAKWVNQADREAIGR